MLPLQARKEVEAETRAEVSAVVGRETEGDLLLPLVSIVVSEILIVDPTKPVPITDILVLPEGEVEVMEKEGFDTDL